MVIRSLGGGKGKHKRLKTTDESSDEDEDDESESDEAGENTKPLELDIEKWGLGSKPPQDKSRSKR